MNLNREDFYKYFTHVVIGLFLALVLFVSVRVGIVGLERSFAYWEQDWLEDTVHQWCVVHMRPDLEGNVCRSLIAEEEACYMILDGENHPVDCVMYAALQAEYKKIEDHFSEKRSEKWWLKALQ